MSAATIAATANAWNDLKDIDEVEPVNSDDRDCLLEIREVLKRHGRQDRFGVALLHKHFALRNDELLVERTNKELRTLIIQPVTPQDAGSTVGTIFRLGDGEAPEAFLGCMQYCGKDVHGNHSSFHRI